MGQKSRQRISTQALLCVIGFNGEIMTKPQDVIESFIALARVPFSWSQLKMVLPRMEWAWSHLRRTTCWSWLWSACGGSSRVIYSSRLVRSDETFVCLRKIPEVDCNSWEFWWLDEWLGNKHRGWKVRSSRNFQNKVNVDRKQIFAWKIGGTFFQPSVNDFQPCFKTPLSHSHATQAVHKSSLPKNSKQSLPNRILENLSWIRLFPFRSNLIVRPVEWRTKPAPLQFETLSHLRTMSSAIYLPEVSANRFAFQVTKYFCYFFLVFFLASFRVWKVCGSTINNEVKSKKGNPINFSAESTVITRPWILIS